MITCSGDILNHTGSLAMHACASSLIYDTHAHFMMMNMHAWWLGAHTLVMKIDLVW